MSSHRTWLNSRALAWFVLVLSLSLLVILASIAMPQKPPDYPSYVSFSPTPDGTKAFYTLLSQNYSKVDTWRKPTKVLPENSSGQMMLIIEPATMNPETDNVDLQKWLEHGNNIWIISRNPAAYFALDTSLVTASVNASSITGFEEWQGTYHATLSTSKRLKVKPQDKVLLKDASGVLALSRKYGPGELTVLLAPEWLTNEGILQEDRLQMLLPFLSRSNPEVIWVNEYAHGYSTSSSIVNVYPEWFMLIIAQGFLVCLLWLWYKGKRFGPVKIPREAQVRFGDERIKAIADWYKAGNFYHRALEIQIDYLRQSMHERWGIPLRIVGPEFFQALEARIPQQLKSQWLEQWRQIGYVVDQKISQKSFLIYSKIIDKMLKEVEYR